jgi:hypothetical protein
MLDYNEVGNNVYLILVNTWLFVLLFLFCGGGVYYLPLLQGYKVID